MVISPHPGGAANVSILTGNARGVCDLDLAGKILASGKYAFRDDETDCTVNVEINALGLDYEKAASVRLDR